MPLIRSVLLTKELLASYKCIPRVVLRPKFYLKLLSVGMMGCFVVACGESGNEHFCAKYSYFYKELTEPGVLPFMSLRRSLNKELSDLSKREDAKIALFVMSDIDRGLKRSSESPQEYCMRRKRWEQYR